MGNLTQQIIVLEPSCCCSVAQLCLTPCTVARQAPLFMGLPRQEYWSGLPFPSPGGSSRPREGTQVSCIGRQILYHQRHLGSPWGPKTGWALRILPDTHLSPAWLSFGKTSSPWYGKESASNAGDLSWTPRLGRSLEKEMAVHSSILAWEIPWTEDPGRLQSIGLQKNWTWLSH